MSCFSLACLLLPRASTWAHLGLPFSPSKEFPHIRLALSLCQNTSKLWLTPLLYIASSESIAFACYLLCFHTDDEEINIAWDHPWIKKYAPIKEKQLSNKFSVLLSEAKAFFWFTFPQELFPGSGYLVMTRSPHTTGGSPSLPLVTW